MSVQSVSTPPITQSSAPLPLKATILTSTTATAQETSSPSLIQAPSELLVIDSPVNNASGLLDAAPAVRHKVATNNKVGPVPGPHRSGPHRSSNSARPGAGHSATATPRGGRPSRFASIQSESQTLHQSHSQPRFTPAESHQNHSENASHSPINANHLLNFTYAQRGHNAADAERSRNAQVHNLSTSTKSNRSRAANKLLFNKELFILAKCVCFISSPFVCTHHRPCHSIVWSGLVRSVIYCTSSNACAIQFAAGGARSRQRGSQCARLFDPQPRSRPSCRLEPHRTHRMLCSRTLLAFIYSVYCLHSEYIVQYMHMYYSYITVF